MVHLQCAIVHMLVDAVAEQASTTNTTFHWEDAVLLLPPGPARDRIAAHLGDKGGSGRLRGACALLWRMCGHYASARLDTHGTPFLPNMDINTSDDDVAAPSAAVVGGAGDKPPTPGPPPSWLSVPYNLGRTMEGRPFFLQCPAADLSVSHSNTITTYAACDGYRRVGVDVEEVSLWRCCSPEGDAAGLRQDASQLQSLRVFLEHRARRLMPNFAIGELSWIFQDPTGSLGASSVRVHCPRCSTRSQPQSMLTTEVPAAPRCFPFSAFPAHASIRDVVASEYFRQLDSLRPPSAAPSSAPSAKDAPNWSKQQGCGGGNGCAWCYGTALHGLQWRLYLLWTLKEAYVKALGHGIPFGMDRIVYRMADWSRLDDVLAGAFHRSIDTLQRSTTEGCVTAVAEPLHPQDATSSSSHGEGCNEVHADISEHATIFVDGVPQDKWHVVVFASPSPIDPSVAAVGTAVLGDCSDAFLVNGARYDGERCRGDLRHGRSGGGAGGDDTAVAEEAQATRQQCASDRLTVAMSVHRSDVFCRKVLLL